MEVVSKNVIVQKFGLKCLINILLKISLHVLVENAKPFRLICDYYSTVNNEGGACIFVSVINGWTDRRTAVHFFRISSMVAWINTDRQQNNTSPQ